MSDKKVLAIDCESWESGDEDDFDCLENPLEESFEDSLFYDEDELADSNNNQNDDKVPTNEESGSEVPHKFKYVAIKVPNDSNNMQLRWLDDIEDSRIIRSADTTISQDQLERDSIVSQHVTVNQDQLEQVSTVSQHQTVSQDRLEQDSNVSQHLTISQDQLEQVSIVSQYLTVDQNQTKRVPVRSEHQTINNNQLLQVQSNVSDENRVQYPQISVFSMKSTVSRENIDNNSQENVDVDLPDHCHACDGESICQNFEFTTTQKGKKELVFHGHSYVVRCKSQTSMCWECKFRRCEC